uniref:Uncharacterized protein n=1 Tax=Percolomonas cosmopolitus TaxID=63605 RepID=A0A7S1KLW0_9EUKA|mmetsp:Transcript_11501/g.43156  ORF Transcript_11501/g.43156 Transcript_11501/m.43156 type:complete len:278 (+) Transcript_11501:417-1250(+)
MSSLNSQQHHFPRKYHITASFQSFLDHSEKANNAHRHHQQQMSQSLHDAPATRLSVQTANHESRNAMALYDASLQKAYSKEPLPDSPTHALGKSDGVPKFPRREGKRPASAMNVGNYCSSSAPSAPPPAAHAHVEDSSNNSKKLPTLQKLYRRFYWHSTQRWDEPESPTMGGGGDGNPSSRSIPLRPNEDSSLLVNSPLRYNSQVQYSPELHKPLRLYFVLGFFCNLVWLLAGLRYRNNKDLYVRHLSRWMLVLWVLSCGVLSLFFIGALAIFVAIL